MKMKPAVRLIVPLALLLLGGLLFHQISQNNEEQTYESLTMVLDIKSYDDERRGLINGYNYELIKRFGQSRNISSLNVKAAARGESWLDSLLTNAADIVIRPVTDTLSKDLFVISHPIDSMTVWVAAKDKRKIVRHFNKWLSSNRDTVLRDNFMDIFNNPFSVAKLGLKRRYLSPYDSLFKAYAPQLGWDWRLLAAVAWQESRFRIDARSHRGALGLMQLRPKTAAIYNAGNLLDPEENIRVGVEYLAFLQKYFKNKTANEELIKFTLAAYNAGPGRVTDCINFAKHLDAYDGTWDSVLSILPEMESESVLKIENVKNGRFSSEQTTGYVENILALHGTFKKILLSSPDQPSR